MYVSIVDYGTGNLNSVSKALEVAAEQISKKISSSLKGRIPKNTNMFKNSFWWNNGIINKRSSICPGTQWVKGKIKKKV